MSERKIDRFDFFFLSTEYWTQLMLKWRKKINIYIYMNFQYSFQNFRSINIERSVIELLLEFNQFLYRK